MKYKSRFLFLLTLPLFLVSLGGCGGSSSSVSATALGIGINTATGWSDSPFISGDGKRLYFTSSLLAHWDKGGADNEQFLRAYGWDGKELKPTFDLDFTALKLGRAHHMLFGSTKIGAARTTLASN